MSESLCTRIDRNEPHGIQLHYKCNLIYLTTDTYIQLSLCLVAVCASRTCLAFTDIALSNRKSIHTSDCHRILQPPSHNSLRDAEPKYVYLRDTPNNEPRQDEISCQHSSNKLQNIPKHYFSTELAAASKRDSRYVRSDKHALTRAQ